MMSGKTILLVDADSASLSFLTRLMQKQHYTVFQTTLGKEGLIYAWRDRPDLIIFDPVLLDISTVQFLKKLRQDERTADTPVLALSSDPNPTQKDACLVAGCNEYLVKSGDAVTSLPKVTARLIGGEQVQEIIDSEDNGFLVVFLSAKGGTGTSSLCANLATTMCDYKPKASVVVTDFVLPIGSIGPIVGYKGDLDLVSVAKLPWDEITGQYFKTHLPEMKGWRFQLLPGARDPKCANELQIERIPEIINVLRTAYDYVIVDLGRSLSRISLPIIQKADLLILIVNSDQSTVILTRKVWDYLQSLGVSDRKIYPILNRAVGLEGLTKSDVEEMIGLEINTTIPYMGGNVGLASNQNKPILAKYKTNTTSLVFRNTAARILELLDKMRVS